jgi:hypothetical protein
VTARPKVHPGPYHIANNRLMFRSEELLEGPLLQLEMFARVLNASRPKDYDLAPTLRALIGMTRDCSFAMGERLLHDGTPIRMVTRQTPPQKRRPD